MVKSMWCGRVLSLLLLGPVLVGCSSSDEGLDGDEGAKLKKSDAGASDDGIITDVLHTGDSNSNLGDGETCSAQNYQGQGIPVDMYVMMDKSGSMLDVAGTGQTKWDAIRTAMTTFLQDTRSTGLSVGIQFFPIEALPLYGCYPNECPQSSMACLIDQTNTGYCFTECSGGSSICNGAECVGLQLGDGSIFNGCMFESCNVSAYSAPQMEIAALPGAAPQLINAINAQAPYGGTPTVPAITGAIDHARSWAGQHPDHRVVVVLATDGLPTQCPAVATIQQQDQSVQQAAQAAASAATGVPQISTYVIGVVAPADQSEDNLHSIAQGGGTNQAFIIDPGQDVSAQFLEALAQIRGQILSCEFFLPEVEGELDFNRVNMTYTHPSGSGGTIFYVESAAGCDPSTGGWYYDVLPSAGVPTKIVVCPTTCEGLKTAGGAISIAYGCKTEGPPIK